MDLQALNKELYYHPAWHDDKEIFIRLANMHTLSKADILELGRLRVKYEPVISLHHQQINRYFAHLIKKAGCIDEEDLFSITLKIHHKIS